MTPRVRFAPSPTGNLHVGGARTALFNYLFAKATGGKFLLRIEDTDRTRYSAEAEESLQKELKWLGLEWDEGPGVPGDFGPYKQSERLELYKKHALELLQAGQAYYCFCTPERLEDLKKKQSSEKSFSGYDRHCRQLSPKEAQERAEAGEKFVIRLKVPLIGSTKFSDLIRGEIEFQHSELDDIVLYKSNGFPSYHLANVVDDHTMCISHVMRGEEWIPSTPKHVLLYQAFGWQPPLFAHLPVILSPQGGKLSKRDGAASVGEYRQSGYLPQALNNFLALLGWNPGGETEIMDQNTLVSCFTLERIQAKSCAFDTKKLDWMNRQYLAQLPAEEWLPEFRKGLTQLGVVESDFTPAHLLAVVGLMRSRVEKMQELASKSLYFFQDPNSYDEKGIKKIFGEDGVVQRLADLTILCAQLETWSAHTLEAAFHNQAQEKTQGLLGLWVHPARLALTGVTGGPGLFELMELLTPETVQRRLHAAQAFIIKANSP